ncbi:hypothetical protein EC912_102810 [Luteibacter rhizovicinus]|uniref:T6SS immunity protein Tdi1 C-terminal domain-containing protein n=1 Tax=Luteibacter rhizovicinus TaxID=242606 RepID=A0A4V2W4M3_9GAMM|nr:T6SS immunity protein Tdi1 domain-containing protein [Luteibacter rhizovicinus]TCV96459.1 hypothetical protein EC912_102810 [Luteibacter rhizovicinus]
MALTWDDLICKPDAEAIEALAKAWEWRVGIAFTPLLFTALGDMFYEADEGGVYWLNTGTGENDKVAETVPEFNELLRGKDVQDDWLLPLLIEALRDEGKVLRPGECYTYVTLPVFADGVYEPHNMRPVPAIEHFSETGELIEAIQGLSDGTDVEFEVRH